MTNGASETRQSLGARLRSQLGSQPLAALPAAPQAQTHVEDDRITTMCRLGEDWIIGIEFVRDELDLDRPVELTILAARSDSDVALTTSVLRAIPLGQLIDAARAVSRDASVLYDAYEAAIAEELIVWTQDARRTGAKRSGLAYAALAARYADLVARGDRKPAETLGAELDMSPVTVSQRIREARQSGLLTPAVPGRASGRLTREAVRLLGDLWMKAHGKVRASKVEEAGDGLD
ncbi:hypothetical protein [Angustibacter luteus]|uniref:HTH crp-type domain-containing protein n=1 Tax=Angustibacter luteus TaxID=658456 RepID=A0ABW1JCH0_9ACTN